MKKTLNFKNFYKIENLDSVSSTNDYLKPKASKNEVEGYVVIANSQTNGKGQRGRVFSSPKDTGIYMSVLLKPELELYPYITRLIAVAVCKSIRELSGKEAQIKWVNDIFINGKKCAGILCESNIEEGYVVCGIGVNVYTPENGFDKAIKDIAISCLDGKKNAKELLIDLILKNIYELYTSKNKGYISSEYKNLSFLIGKEIFVLKDNAVLCKVIDILDDGSLYVQYMNGHTESILSGDIQVKY